MKYQTVVERIGEDLGPVDWAHPIAAELEPDSLALLQEVEKAPEAFLFCPSGFSTFRILGVTMYDGWPYWAPTPTLSYIGPLQCVERRTLDSFMKHTIERKKMETR